MKKTKLIDLILSLNFNVVGHGATIENIEKHMNFSNGEVRICLTDDNEHIYCVRSNIEHLVGGYDGNFVSEQVVIDNNIIKLLEPFLLEKESIVTNIKNWKYDPYEKRRQKEIKFHNEWCRKNGFEDLLIKEN